MRNQTAEAFSRAVACHPRARQCVPASAVLLAVLSLHFLSPAHAGAATDDSTAAARRTAIERGLKWLAGRAPLSTVEAENRSNGSIATDSLAGIALLASGAVPGDDGIGKALRTRLDQVLATQRPDGVFEVPRPVPATRPAGIVIRAGYGFGGSGNMYDQGFTTLFLAETYAVCRERAAKDGADSALARLAETIAPKLQKAVVVIECSQSRQGGWRYQAMPYDDDVSVTAVQFTALYAARESGIDVDAVVMKDAAEYVRKCQNADGGFRYMVSQAGDSGPARTAAAITVLESVGDSVEGVRNGLAYLKGVVARDRELMGSGHYYYLQYYLARAMRFRGEKGAETWYPAMIADLLKRQQTAGEWTGDAGEDYATAMALIVLQLPEGRLPHIGPATRPAGTPKAG